MLCKHKVNRDIEYAPVYFNSATRAVISSDKYGLDKSFQEILYRIDNWIIEGSGWIIESIDGEYVNISAYSPLMGSTYIELPTGLKNPMKGLINIKNNVSKCFLWCHIRHLRIQRQNNICINVFCYENGLTYTGYVSDQKFHNSMDLLLISNENKSHYVYIKDFNRFTCNKIKSKNKKYFCKCCLQCFSSEKVFVEHKQNCLIINGKQSLELKSSSISFKNYFKQLSVPFKIYADFECILKESKVVIKIMAHTQKNIKHIFLAVLQSCMY